MLFRGCDRIVLLASLRGIWRRVFGAVLGGVAPRVLHAHFVSFLLRNMKFSEGGTLYRPENSGGQFSNNRNLIDPSFVILSLGPWSCKFGIRMRGSHLRATCSTLWIILISLLIDAKRRPRCVRGVMLVSVLNFPETKDSCCNDELLVQTVSKISSDILPSNSNYIPLPKSPSQAKHNSVRYEHPYHHPTHMIDMKI